MIDLPPVEAAPTRALAVTYCATSDLDAVVSVEVSTIPGGWNAGIEARDARGRVVRLRAPRPATPLAPWMPGSDSADQTSLALTGPDPSPAQDADLRRAEEASQDDGPPLAPRLRIDSNKLALLGVAPIGHDEMYEIVGRPDLAGRYRTRSALNTLGKVVGWVSIGAAIASFTVIFVAEMVSDAYLRSLTSLISPSQTMTSSSVKSHQIYLIPAALALAGAGMLVTTGLVPKNPVSFEEQEALVREYNARLDPGDSRPETPQPRPWPRHLSISAGALPTGAGLALLVSGKF